ncbi:MAG: hypothetical protein ABR588_04055 [Sphingomicrobium sp.]|nr:nucleoside 2-deoxyribosyltransferase [Sphingomonadales bacterium]
MSEAKPLSCFVSFSAASADMAARLTDVLQSMDVEVFRPDLFVGQEIGREILAAIQAADFVCLIADAGLLTPNAAFESGLAIGLGKPALALTTADTVPFDLQERVQVIRVKSGDVDAARRDIARFVRHVRPRKGGENMAALHVETEGRARAELTRLRQAKDFGQRGAELTGMVERAFKQQGAEVLREEEAGTDARVDLLVWSDPLVTELGGPLIVECKYYPGGAGSVLVNARHAFKQLAGYVQQSSAKLGLLNEGWARHYCALPNPRLCHLREQVTFLNHPH